MKSLEAAILAAMIETGRASIGWKLKITRVDTLSVRSDWATVHAQLIKPRCRKPCLLWELAINMARETIHWDKSNAVKP